MKIYLMQHGKALPKDQDPEKGLSEEGAREVTASAKGLHRLGVRPDVFFSSPKKRARQTAMLAQEELNPGAGEPVISETLSPLAPPGEALDFIGEAAQGKGCIFVAGHLPSLARITGLLLFGEPAEPVAFINAGAVLIDASEPAPGKGVLERAIGPGELARLA